MSTSREIRTDLGPEFDPKVLNHNKMENRDQSATELNSVIERRDTVDRDGYCDSDLRHTLLKNISFNISVSLCNSSLITYLFFLLF